MRHEKRKYFITGLLIVLPVLITIYLFISLFSFFDNILGRYINRLTMYYFGYKVPGLGLLVFIVLIFFTGFFATNFIGRRFLLHIENLWFKFPIVGKIYPAAKQIVKFLFSQKTKGQIEKVCLVEYPREGIYTLGFVTNESDKAISDKAGGKDLLNILIPSVPSPLTGFLILVPREDVILLDMTVEDAVKMIISGGVFNPKDLIEKRVTDLEE